MEILGLGQSHWKNRAFATWFHFRSPKPSHGGHCRIGLGWAKLDWSQQVGHQQPCFGKGLSFWPHSVALWDASSHSVAHHRMVWINGHFYDPWENEWMHTDWSLPESGRMQQEQNQHENLSSSLFATVIYKRNQQQWSRNVVANRQTSMVTIPTSNVHLGIISMYWPTVQTIDHESLKSAPSAAVNPPFLCQVFQQIPGRAKYESCFHRVEHFCR